jgi:hypothetical protein
MGWHSAAFTARMSLGLNLTTSVDGSRFGWHLHISLSCNLQGTDGLRRWVLL